MWCSINEIFCVQYGEKCKLLNGIFVKNFHHSFDEFFYLQIMKIHFQRNAISDRNPCQKCSVFMWSSTRIIRSRFLWKIIRIEIQNISLDWTLVIWCLMIQLTVYIYCRVNQIIQLNSYLPYSNWASFWILFWTWFTLLEKKYSSLRKLLLELTEFSVIWDFLFQVEDFVSDEWHCWT